MNRIIQFSCKSCSIGTYNSQTGSTAETSCRDCPVGRYNDEEGRGSDCKACPKGFESDGAIVTHCTVCGFSKYQDQDVVTSVKCKTCLDNTYISDDKQEAVVHDNVNDCLSCPDGTFSTSGERACSSCAAGKEQKNSICVDCDAGQFSVAKTDGTPITCEKCPKGSYQDQVGTPYCLPCIPGSYNNFTGQTSCLPCAKNTISSVPAATSCFPCGIGEFAEVVVPVNDPAVLTFDSASTVSLSSSSGIAVEIEEDTTYTVPALHIVDV